jgi:hypothetical protein
MNYKVRVIQITNQFKSLPPYLFLQSIFLVRGGGGRSSAPPAMFPFRCTGCVLIAIALLIPDVFCRVHRDLPTVSRSDQHNSRGQNTHTLTGLLISAHRARSAKCVYTTKSVFGTTKFLFLQDMSTKYTVWFIWFKYHG